MIARREVPIEGARAHPGGAGDVIQRGRDALLAESLECRVEKQLAIAGGVGAQRA